MSDNPKIAEVSASVNGGEYSPLSLVFRMDVNTFPVVNANVAELKEKVSVKAPMSQEVLARLGKLQNQRLAGRSDPDFVVTAEDGIGGSMRFSGYIVAPVLELTKYTTIDRLSAIGAVAAIDALDLSIYDAKPGAERKESGDGMKHIEAAKSGELDKVLTAITDVLVGNFDFVLAKENRALSQELLKIQHDINNSGPLDLWKEILSNSKIKYDSWDAAFAEYPPIARELSSRVKDFLVAKTSGFWGHIKSLMSSFKLYYIQAFDGVGYLERSDKKVSDPQLTIAVSASGISIADGSSRILQPGGVVMMMRGGAAERAESQPDPELPRIVAYAPDPVQSGFIHREPPPFWLLREEVVPIFKDEVSTVSVSAGQVSLSLSDREEARKSGHQYKAKVDTVSEGIMTELCEVIFKEIQLAQSTATLTMPLSFAMNEYVGKRATVKIQSGDGGDGGQFTAFISGITHSVDLQQGKQLNSSTELRLSHADYR